MTDWGLPLPSRYKDQWQRSQIALPSRPNLFTSPLHSPFRSKMDLISASGLGNSVLSNSSEIFPMASVLDHPKNCSELRVQIWIAPSSLLTIACVTSKTLNNSPKWRSVGSLSGVATPIGSACMTETGSPFSLSAVDASVGIVNEKMAPSPGCPAAQIRPPFRSTMR